MDPPESTGPEGAEKAADLESAADVRTFLIVDVRGYTSFTQAYGDEEAGKLAAKFAVLAREAVSATGGEVVELRGDEALCVFRSARQALRAAVELQRRFRERLNDQPVFPLGIGIGLDSGEAVPIEGGYRGGALNLAARLCGLAAPGQILASETVTSLSRALEGVRFVDRRPVRVKGLEKPVRVIEVVPTVPLPPVPQAGLPTARRGVRWRLVAIGVGAVVALTVAVAAGLQLARDGGGETIAGSGLGEIDPRSGEILDTTPLGTAPSTVAVGDGTVWVIDADDRTVSRIDLDEPGDPHTFSTGSTPTDLAVGEDAVWVGDGTRLLPESVSRLDPESGTVVDRIDLPRGPGGFGYLSGVTRAASRQHIAVTRDAVWAINPDATVSRIDPRSNRLVARVDRVSAINIAAANGRVWIVDSRGRVAEINARTNTVAREIKVAAESLAMLAVGGGAVWVVDPLGGSVWRIDPDPDPAEVVLRTIPLDKWVNGIAFGEGAVWATNEIADKVYRIDPRTNTARVVTQMPEPRGIAVGQRATWVTTAGPPSEGAALPASECSDIFYGREDSPQFLLVSDLPLQGYGRASTGPMVDGIRFALEGDGFEAGGYSVGYQSCDSSTAQGGESDEYRCLLNAKAYARNLEVAAVIGAFTSLCSYYQIPLANEAPQGPLAMISPSNTFTGLTRPFRGWPPKELRSLYPSGERSYVRIAAANHLLAVAEVELAKDLGAKSVFLLGDEDGMAASARQAARSLGLEIAGSATWDSEAKDFAGLARKIARRRPEAVALFGLFERNEGALIRDLRAALGRDVPLIANDGFLLPDGLVDAAGPAAVGVYLGVYGLPNRELPPEGKRFLREFEAAQGGGPTPSYTATYGAQAVEILLAAIARSDGTRSSVTRELRRTTVEDGILGDIRFDTNGDLVEGPVTFFRAVREGQSNSFETISEGVVFDRVVTARAALLR